MPRADLPGPRALRLTLDSRFDWWNTEFVNGTRTDLGAPLTGDPLAAGPALPGLRQLQTDLALAANAPAVLTLGRSRFSAQAQRRITPLTVEFGVTGNFAVGVTVPLVRTMVRASFALDSAGGNLALSPLLTDPAAAALYAGFFDAFDTALTRLQNDIAAGAYGCPGSPQCAQAQAFLADGQGIREALHRSVYGSGTGGGAGLLPRAGSGPAAAVDSNVVRLQDEFRTAYGDSSFAAMFPFPADTAPLTAGQFEQALTNSGLGYDLHPLTDTRRRERFWLGDVELQARYRLVHRPAWTATVGLLWRLPTGHQESPNDALDLAAGDGQTDFEAQLVQELTWRRLWLNLALRGGIQRPGHRGRRVAPSAAVLVPPQARATLDWDPGDYVGLDCAPLYRFHPQFAAGITLGWYRKGEDRYAYRTVQDSVDLAGRLGMAVPAGVLDGGTALQRTRVGVALTYAGPAIETGVTAERTVNAAEGRAPAGWTIRLVLRVARRLF